MIVSMRVSVLVSMRVLVLVRVTVLVSVRVRMTVLVLVCVTVLVRMVVPMRVLMVMVAVVGPGGVIVRSPLRLAHREIPQAAGEARRMRAAANAAPKPLSMLTTVMPDAHDVSIPRRAASPSNAAP